MTLGGAAELIVSLCSRIRRVLLGVMHEELIVNKQLTFWRPAVNGRATSTLRVHGIEPVGRYRCLCWDLPLELRPK